MKFKKLISAIMAAAVIATSTIAPSSYNPMSVVCEAASTTKIKAPKITSTSSTTDTVSITWNKVTGADAYAIYQYNSSSKQYEYLGYVNGTSCTINKLASNSTYYFAVASCTISNKQLYIQNYSYASAKTKSQKEESIDIPDFTGWSLADAYNVLTEAGVSSSQISYKTDKGKKIYVKNNFQIKSQKFSNGKLCFVCKRVKYTGVIDAAYDFFNSPEYKEVVNIINKAKTVYDEAEWFINLFKSKK